VTANREHRLVRFDEVAGADPDILYRDRVGPWWDIDGDEIIPVGTEAVERAVELVVGTYAVRSSVAAFDGGTVDITFPMLTLLIQDDWDRVMGALPPALPSRGFLIAYGGGAAATGRLAEDLICQALLASSLGDVLGGVAVDAATAASQHGLITPATGVRSDDLVVITDDGLVLLESKCTVGRWSYLRRMGSKGVEQLRASAESEERVQRAGIVATSLSQKRIGLWLLPRYELLGPPLAAVVDRWRATHDTWRT
jgi:hypothetical protein